jgi:RHS repeat-associated protein
LGGQEFEPQKMGSDLNTRYRNLYNGNIAHMGTLLPKIKGSGSWTGTNAALSRNISPEMLGNVYHYDQLNRITKHFAFDNYNAPTGSGTGNWQNGGPSMGTAEHHETFAYDGSGNITRLARNSGTAPAAGGTTGQVGDGPTMDNLTYRYHTQSLTITLQQSGGGTVSINVLQNNKLYTVNEAIHSGAYSGDIDDQGSFSSSASTINTANNYGYDKLGNLIRDNAEEIAEIGWTSTGKIEFIKRSTGSKKPDLRYGYDATGTRLFKVVQPKQQSGTTAGTRMSQEHWDTTWYIKDASGNAMATYTTSHKRLYTAQPANSTLLKKFTLDELHIYGSQRHGLLKSSQLLVQQEYSLTLGDVIQPDSLFPTQTEGMFTQIQSTEYGITNYTEGEFTFTRGHKQYELSNHLGNVLVTIQDRKWGRQNAPQTNCDYYLSYVVTITDYHAFGSTVTERSASFGGGYRFGFNNQEKESELGDYYAFEYRIHDARLGRFLSVDPLEAEYPWNSVYAFSENRLIDSRELEGLEAINVITGEGCGACTVGGDIVPQALLEKAGVDINDPSAVKKWGIENPRMPMLSKVPLKPDNLKLLKTASDVSSAASIGISVKNETIDYAVRSSYKSAQTRKEFSKLSPTQKAWRTTNTLGKTGTSYLKFSKGLGVGANVVGVASATIQLVEKPTAGNATRLGVQGLAIGASFIPVVGWGISLSIGAADLIWGDKFYNYIDKQ